MEQKKMKDKQIEELIQLELERQQNTIELIASENIVSKDVMEAVGSVLTNKYAEGRLLRREELDKQFDGNFNIESYLLRKDLKIANRYYNGCDIIDKIEYLATSRFQALFKTDYHVNVQPHSGAQANMAVFEALLEHGDTVLSMDLSNGGHLSHGSPVNYSGKHFNVVQYGINENGEIDYDEVRKLAFEHNPKLIICGASNYSKIINFEKFADIVTCLDSQFDGQHYLLADIAHIAGLVAGGVHPSPFGYADIVTTTTHKSLRGPRGGVIACKEELAKKIDSAVFPGIQGGPLEHVIAGKAVCFYEALQPEFKEYAEQIVKNARILCGVLNYRGFKTVGGMTENHLMTVDLRKSYMCEELTGKDAANLLDKYGITVNKNTVPDDPRGPFVTSGLRIGVPAVTTRGFKEVDMKEVGNIIADILQYHDEKWEDIRLMAKDRAFELCKKYPIYK